MRSHNRPVFEEMKLPGGRVLQLEYDRHPHPILDRFVAFMRQRWPRRRWPKFKTRESQWRRDNYQVNQNTNIATAALRITEFLKALKNALCLFVPRL
jgi:hypothetical protein